MSATDPDADPFDFFYYPDQYADEAGLTLVIAGNSARVTVGTNGEIDYESNSQYTVSLVVSDGLDSGGASSSTTDDEITFIIKVIDVDEPPVIIGPTEVDYAEDRDDAPAQYAAYDPERRMNVTLSLEGRDSGKFTLSRSGVLAFRIGVDYEKQDEHRVTIKAVDDANKTTTLAVTINVTNVDEPPLITGPVLVIVDEDESATSTAVGDYDATDPESGTITWSLAGADADSFEFEPDPMNVKTGALVKLIVHNYENPGDANRDNTYVVTLQASDGTHTVSRPIRFVVTDVNETPVMTQPPAMTHPPAWTIDENWTGLVGTLVVTDDLGSDLIWTLIAHELDGFALRPRARSSGAEQRADLFAERPLNVEEDPSRNLMVQVSDGHSTVGRSLMVSLTDVAEPGTLTLAPWRPRVGAMYRAELNEPDMIIGSAEWSWELATNSGGPWTPALGSVALSNNGSRITPLIEDVNQFLRVTVTYADRHGAETLQAVSPTRVGAKGSDPNTAPVFNAEIPGADNTKIEIMIREDAPAGTVVTTAPEATDSDGDSVYCTLSDNAEFVIDSRSRQVRIAQGAMLDHELIGVHYFTVNAVDDRHEGTALQFEVHVEDVNERPAAVEQWVTTNEDEELRIDLPLGGDPDNESPFLTFTQPPNGKATAAPDQPDQPDQQDQPVQTDLTYTPRTNFYGQDYFTYRLTDQAGLSDTGTIRVLVTPGNDPPVFASETATRTVSERARHNDPVGVPVVATDVDGDALTYSLSGSSEFLIDKHTGQIRVSMTATLDAAREPTHTFTVTATDGDNRQAVTTVTINVIQGPAARYTGQFVAGPGRTGRSGTTTAGGGGGGGGAPPVRLPSDEDFDWNLTRDIDDLHRDNDNPTDIWSDRTTLWILNNPSIGSDSVFAYDLLTGDRQEAREVELDSRNRFSHGIWSDGETIWIADAGRDSLFAYELSDGSRLEDRDIELAERNRDPRGIWSDGETLYVLDSVKDALFVYNLETAELDAEHALHSLNKSPRGIWSDGVSIWVSDDGANRIFAYRIDDETLARLEAEEFGFRVLIKAGNGDARGIWPNGDVLYVVDAEDDRVNTYNIPDAIQAALASLSLSDIDIGEFSPSKLDYQATTTDEATSSIVEATATQESATIAVEPVKWDGDAENGHQVTLGEAATVAVTVTSADGIRTRTYRVTLPETVPNQPPVGNAIPALSLTANAESARLTLSQFFSDPDGDQLEHSLVAPDSSDEIRVELANGVVTVAPVAAGEASFSLTASDGELETSPVRVRVAVAAQAVNAEVVYEVRIVARRLADGRTEFALEERAPDGSWSVSLSPEARFMPANAAVDNWLASSPLSLTTAQVSIEIRIEARPLSDGRMEFALQARVPGSAWGDLAAAAFSLPSSSRGQRTLVGQQCGFSCRCSVTAQQQYAMSIPATAESWRLPRFRNRRRLARLQRCRAVAVDWNDLRESSAKAT